MVGAGQIGFGETLALCLLGGSLVGLAALAVRPAARLATWTHLRSRRRARMTI